MPVPDLFFPNFRPSVFLRSVSDFINPSLGLSTQYAQAVSEVTRLEVLVLLSEANDFKARELESENSKLRRSNARLSARNTQQMMRLKEFSGFSVYDPVDIESVPSLPVDASDLFM